MTQDQKPTVPYWHLWVDDEGISHQTRCSLADFEMKSIAAGVAPQWSGRKTSSDMTITVTVLPAGWVGEWHENPKPQWIIPLSGRWSVESMDGTCVEMGAGEMSFGEDQNTRGSGGRTGHLSRTLGSEPAVLMVAQFGTPPTVASPCRFR
ncbi:MAG TPA: cupin domain-containing protein [Acetobacteraceae bacterium]|nr:cupin domain-containing protein [Acetobacteraceae bacterium]